MNLTEIRKYIVLMLMVGILWLLLIFDFNLKETFIFPVANQLVKHNLIIVVILGIAGIVGLTYKNKKSYYSAYINAELIIGYVVFLSMCVTGFYKLSSILTYLWPMLFTIAYTFLFITKDKLKYNGFKGNSNKLNPIYNINLLYAHRKNQASRLIRFIESSSLTRNGYSICVNGEWGAGKTSFVNSVLDELTNEGEGEEEKEQNKKRNRRIKVKEIRLNAMELDDLESLVKYFFERMKNILHTEGVYVGINSEYQKLMSSLIGAVIDEKISYFILSRFTTNSDYRENLENLNQLISRELKNTKIVIVVDDIERCDKAKIKDFLFFIKEIAMLSHCITIFVVDYNKLLRTHGISNDFMEKFFNETINLLPVNEKEIAKKSIGDNLYLKYLNEAQILFAKNIDKIYENKYPGVSDKNQKEEERKKDLQEAKKQQDTFNQLICNPRRLIKCYYKYIELLKTVEQYIDLKTSEQDDTKTYCLYLKKINYKKQIFLLSLIYGLFPNEYEYFEIYGLQIHNYSLFEPTKEFPENEQNSKILIYILAENEWCTLSSNYIVHEKLRFCSYLLSEPDKLPLIANGFSSLSEEYAASIRNNQKPNNIDLNGILSEFIPAKFNSVEEKEEVITNTILLYKNEIDFDDLLTIITNSHLLHDITRDGATLHSLCKTSKQLNMINKKKCKEQFLLFAQRYLVFKLTSINRLILCVYMPKDTESYTNITEVVYNKADCNKMIDAYSKNIRGVFNIKKSGSGLRKLKKIYWHITTILQKHKLTTRSDVINYLGDARNTISDIKCLFSIEKYINNYKVDFMEDFDFSTGNYSETLNALVRKINQNDKYKSYDLQEQITALFNSMLTSNETFSSTDLNNIDSIIQNFHNLTGNAPAPWRNIYIQLKSRNANSEQTENNKNVTK